MLLGPRIRLPVVSPSSVRHPSVCSYVPPFRPRPSVRLSVLPSIGRASVRRPTSVRQSVTVRHPVCQSSSVHLSFRPSCVCPSSFVRPSVGQPVRSFRSALPPSVGRSVSPSVRSVRPSSVRPSVGWSIRPFVRPSVGQPVRPVRRPFVARPFAHQPPTTHNPHQHLHPHTHTHN